MLNKQPIVLNRKSLAVLQVATGEQDGNATKNVFIREDGAVIGTDGRLLLVVEPPLIPNVHPTDQVDAIEIATGPNGVAVPADMLRRLHLPRRDPARHFGHFDRAVPLTTCNANAPAGNPTIAFTERSARPGHVVHEVFTTGHAIGWPMVFKTSPRATRFTVTLSLQVLDKLVRAMKVGKWNHVHLAFADDVGPADFRLVDANDCNGQGAFGSLMPISMNQSDYPARLLETDVLTDGHGPL